MLKKILVVDDEEAIINFLREVLVENGYQVLGAASGAQALDIIRQERDCRIVMTDIMMPDMNGLELMDALKKERPQIIVLMMTAYASWETVTASIQKGAYDYIKKPFSIPDMLQSIGNACRRFELENENMRLKTLFSLFSITSLIRGKIDIDDMSSSLLSFLLEHVESCMDAVIYFEEGGTDIQKIFESGRRFDWRSFLLGKPLNSRKVLYTSDRTNYSLPEEWKEIEVAEDPAIMGMELDILYFPLEENGVLLGVLLAGKNFHENPPFYDSDLRFISIVAQQVCSSLSNRRLYFLLENKVSELQKTNEQLEKTRLNLIQTAKLASAGELAAGIAHEIGNPLFSIRGTAELLVSRKSKYKLSAELLDALGVIIKQSSRAQEIAGSLLTFARKKDGQRNPLDMNALIRDTFALMKVLFLKQNIDVSLELAQDLPPVFGDRQQLSQVIFNILLNARDALSETGGRVWIRTREDSGMVYADITDNGPGISRETADKMFVPFFTTKDADKGHGLGLSISHGIMENHRGRLSFRSSPGEGTVFTAALPVMNEKESRKGAAGRQ